MKLSAKQILKRIVLSIVGVLVILIAAFCYFYVPNPMKITDPYHQSFKLGKFKFEDYPGICLEKEVLAKLFPVGTEKDFVERVLVNAGGATSRKLPEHVGKGSNAYSYFYEHQAWYLIFGPKASNIAVTYDENDQVVNITVPTDRNGENAYSFYEDCRIGKEYGRNWK